MSKVAILYSIPLLMYIVGFFVESKQLCDAAGLMGVLLSAIVSKAISEQNDSKRV